jgi:hypothetical protein
VWQIAICCASWDKIASNITFGVKAGRQLVYQLLSANRLPVWRDEQQSALELSMKFLPLFSIVFGLTEHGASPQTPMLRR